jgi:hypothetical protein
MPARANLPKPPAAGIRPARSARRNWPWSGYTTQGLDDLNPSIPSESEGRGERWGRTCPGDFLGSKAGAANLGSNRITMLGRGVHSQNAKKPFLILPVLWACRPAHNVHERQPVALKDGQDECRTGEPVAAARQQELRCCRVEGGAAVVVECVGDAVLSTALPYQPTQGSKTAGARAGDRRLDPGVLIPGGARSSVGSGRPDGEVQRHHLFGAAADYAQVTCGH